MRTAIFQVDAFTSQRFAGNPAAVMPMERFPADALMQMLARENNLSETAFIVPHGAEYRIRWFTPSTEVPLCGHATLASAAVLMERLEPRRTQVTFHSASGPLPVRRAAAAYVMDFPARVVSRIDPPPALAVALRATPLEVCADDCNYLARLASAEAVRALAPDYAALAALQRDGIIVTAAGDRGFDFTSRYFAPSKGVSEDPVTGSAHCALAPYWSERLGKRVFRAFQASARGGEMSCRWTGERVELEGACVFYLEGQAEI